MTAGKNIAEEWRTKREVYSSGFTLIELLTVIVVMAMIVAIAAPAFVGIGRGAGMRGAVSGAKATLSLLRQWAITHRERVTFCYFAGSPTSASYYYATNEFGIVLEKTNELPMEVVFVPDDGISDSITFKTDGGLTGNITDPFTITIEDRKFPGVASKAKRIVIHRLTGGIHVE